MAKSAATFTPFPVFTQIVSSVYVAWTLATTAPSDADAIVIPGAEAPSQPPSTSYFPSRRGQFASAGAEEAKRPAKTRVLTTKRRFT